MEQRSALYMSSAALGNVVLLYQNVIDISTRQN